MLNIITIGLPWWLKAIPCNARGRFNPWVGMIPWRKEWQPTPVFLPGEFHGQRSLAGYSPWGRKESDMTERLHSLHSLHTLSLEKEMATHSCSCLENPMDRGAWRSVVNGVAESRTRLKWLSTHADSFHIIKSINNISNPDIHSWLRNFLTYGR